jgi:hypothetical protein
MDAAGCFALAGPVAAQPSVCTRALRCGARAARADGALLRLRPCPAAVRARRAGCARGVLACRAAAAAEATPVMVNGVTGKMGFATAEAAAQRGLRLVPVAFSGA